MKRFEVTMQLTNDLGWTNTTVMIVFASSKRNAKINYPYGLSSAIKSYKLLGIKVVAK